VLLAFAECVIYLLIDLHDTDCELLYNAGRVPSTSGWMQLIFLTDTNLCPWTSKLVLSTEFVFIIVCPKVYKSNPWLPFISRRLNLCIIVRCQTELPCTKSSAVRILEISNRIE